MATGMFHVEHRSLAAFGAGEGGLTVEGEGWRPSSQDEPASHRGQEDVTQSLEQFIYLDNAATTWPKPSLVMEAMTDFMAHSAGSPARGSHRLALAAGRTISRCRSELAAFLGARQSSRLVFTLNTTDSLNLAIKGILRPGDHVVTSRIEHNSVTRPLHALGRRMLVATDYVPVSPDGYLDPEDFRRLATPKTRLFILSHASNVTGAVMPVREVGRIARALGIPLLVDGAQTVGLLPINLGDWPVDMLAFPGHKSLLGPPGTGGLFISAGLDLDTVREGGTGTQSELQEQPLQCPERHESGTPNTVGLAGLRAGIAYLKNEGREKIYRHEMGLTNRLAQGLQEVGPRVRLYLPRPELHGAPIVLFNVGEADPCQVSFALDKSYGIACRGGLHCAPSTHRVLGTIGQGGAVRFSPGAFTTAEDIDKAVRAVQDMAIQI